MVEGKAKSIARAWKAIQLYHQTKDISYVKEFLGHKKLDSTLRYINIEKAFAP